MTKSKKRSQAGRYIYKWIGHIEVYFNDDEIQEVLAYVEQRQWDFEDVVSGLTQANYGIKFMYSEADNQYRLTMQPKNKDCYLVGYTIGYSHMDLFRLIQIAAYIVNEMIEHESIDLPTKRVVNTW